MYFSENFQNRKEQPLLHFVFVNTILYYVPEHAIDSIFAIDRSSRPKVFLKIPQNSREITCGSALVKNAQQVRISNATFIFLTRKFCKSILHFWETHCNLEFNLTRIILCHSIPLFVIRCHSLPCVATRTTRCHSMYHSAVFL